MRRLQWTLLLLATGLALSVALLASRALEGVAFEKAARHEAVATRVFDEMERGLSRFLEREEARPFAGYDPGAGLYGRPPESPFVVGYFQIDPDGTLHPPAAREHAAGRTRGSGEAVPDEQTELDRVQEIVAPIQKNEPDLGLATPTALLERRAPPGKTKRLAAPRPQADAAAEPRRQDLAVGSRKDAEGEREANAYEVLQSFNQSAAYRSTRQKKQSLAKASPPAPSAAPTAAREDRTWQIAAAPAYPERPEMAGAMADDRDAPAPAAAAAPALEEQEAKRGTPAEDLLQALLDPMVGRPSGPEHLLLYRTVVVGEQGYRQGLVIDRDRLGEWLREQVLLASAGLERSTRFWFFGAGQEVRYQAPASSLVYEHRFAEPFDAFSVVLALAPLPGVASATSIYALVALVLGVAALGLFAVYRMAYVTLQYAERRSNFVSAVSHELKTPLTAIRMYGEMLRDGLVSDDAKRRSYYETITDESERLSRLINNVLEFSRIERGGTDAALTVGAIGPVLEEAAATLRPHAERAGFELLLEVDDGLPPLRFDRDAVVQLLFNLVDNGLKYAQAAERKQIVVECRQSGDAVRLSVRDFGPGVGRQHVSKLFEPFYRGEDEMTRSARGTGIGLALVKDLAERMNAAASAANAPGGGFVVTVAFQPAPTS
jgi:signal transduction histidine kinase